MHPAIKIVNLIIVSIFLTQGGWLSLLLTGALLLPFYIVHRDLWQPAIKMLFRLKWFFISILLIYYFYTPYIPTLEQSVISQIFGRLSPGLFRISVLVFILFSVNLFIKTTSKEEILSALLWLFLPLKNFNINIERVLLRAVLTLDYIENISQRLSNYKEKKLVDLSYDSKLPFFEEKKEAFLHLIKYSGIIFCEILEEAESTSGKSYTIDCLESPEFLQYFLPLFLCLFFYLTF